MKILSLLVCLFFSALTISAAKASLITINVTPTSGTGALTLTFNTATDGFYSQNGIETSFNAIGTDSLGTFSTVLGFYNPAFFVGFHEGPWDFTYDDRASDELLYTGAKLYSGTEASPTILPGTYSLTAQQAPSNAQIKISLGSSVAVTPEPSSLLLLATGMAGGVMMLRRRLAL